MKGVSRWILPTLLVAAAILAIHQAIIFLQYFPLSSAWKPQSFPLGGRDLTIRINPEERLWLLGDTEAYGKAGKSTRWDQASNAFPNDPSILARSMGTRKLQEHDLDRIARLAPDNAWFDLIIARHHAENVFSTEERKRTDEEIQGIKKSRRRNRRGPGSLLYYQADVVNEEEVDQTIAALTRASEKPTQNSYLTEWHRRWSNAMPPGNDVITRAYDRYWMSDLNISNLLPEFFPVFEHRMKSLAEDGKRKEFLQLKSVMEKILWSRFDSTHDSIELLFTRNGLDAIAKLVTEHADQLEFGPAAEPFKKRAARFEEHFEKRKSKSHSNFFDNDDFSRRLYHPIPFRLSELRAKISDQDLRYGILAEQAHLSWRNFLWGFFVLSAAALILRISMRWLKHPPVSPSRKLIAASVLLPVIGFLIIRYVTPWGGFYKGPG